MEVVYNVKHKFSSSDLKDENKIKELFNKKLINIIFQLEHQNL